MKAKIICWDLRSYNRDIIKKEVEDYKELGIFSVENGEAVVDFSKLKIDKQLDLFLDE